MSNPLCLSLKASLKAQSQNPKRNWTRDVLVCIVGGADVRQAEYKQKVLANQNGNSTTVNGQITKTMRYAKLAKNPGLIICN